MSGTKYQQQVFDFLLPSVVATLLLFVIPSLYAWLAQPTDNSVWWFLLYPLVMKPVIMLMVALAGAALVFAPSMLLLSSAGLNANRTLWLAALAEVLVCFLLFDFALAGAFAGYSVATLALWHAADIFARRRNRK